MATKKTDTRTQMSKETLLPLLAGLWWTILLSAIATSATPAAAASTAGTPADLAVAGASTLLGAAVLALGARVYDVLLLSRDEALAASALRGLELARSLRVALRDHAATADAPRPPRAVLRAPSWRFTINPRIRADANY